jgi:hypothetical protein
MQALLQISGALDHQLQIYERLNLMTGVFYPEFTDQR